MTIHPTAVVHQHAVIGKNCYIGPFCYVGPNVTMGDNNRLESHVVVGTPAEHRLYMEKFGPVIIGNANVLREFVTVQGGTQWITKIGTGCTILRHAHISHDTVIEDDVTISCDVLIGGEGRVMRGANLGLGCVLHQRQLVGSWAMVGMNSTVTRKDVILPGQKYAGSPVKHLGRNTIAMERKGVSDVLLDSETQRFYSLRQSME